MPQQDMRQRFDDWRRCAFKKVGDADGDRAALQPNAAVGVGEGFELQIDGRNGSARPDLAMHALEDCRGAFEEESARHIHGR